MAATTTDRRQAQAGRRVGYLVTVVIDGLLLWGAHQVLGWGWPPFVTGAWEDVLPVLTLSFAAAMVVNALWVVCDPAWFRHLGAIVLNLTGLVVLVRMWQVFPFDFASDPWELLTRVVLAAGLFGIVVGTLVELGQLVRGDDRDDRDRRRRAGSRTPSRTAAGGTLAALLCLVLLVATMTPATGAPALRAVAGVPGIGNPHALVPGPPGGVDLVRRYGSTGSDGAEATAFDAAGNTYVAGHFTGTVNFGGTVLTSAGWADGFVVKLSAAGALVWAVRYGGAGTDSVSDLAVDPSGNPVIGGVHSSAITFGPGMTFTPDGFDSFVVRLSSASGAALWGVPLSGPGDEDVRALTVDANAVTVAGIHTEGLVVGTSHLVDVGPVDGFVILLALGTGSLRWAENVTGSTATSTTVADVAVDRWNGRVVVVGHFDGGWVAMGGRVLHPNTGSVPWTPMVGIYQTDGSVQWARTFSGTGSLGGVAVDGGANTYVGGHYYDAGSFDGIPLPDPAGSDAFVARLGSGGDVNWVRTMGGPGGDGVHDVAASPGGDIAVSGTFSGTATILGTTLSAVGPEDEFVGAVNASGTELWVDRAGGASDEDSTGLAADDDRVAAGFGFTGTASFSGTNLTAVGSWDAAAVIYDTDPDTASRYVPITPTRLLDSREGIGGYSTPWWSGATRALRVRDTGPVPDTATAVALNVTVTGPTAASHLTVWPWGTTRPSVSTLNFVAGQTVANGATVVVGSADSIGIHNNAGSVDVVIDAVGYYADVTGAVGFNAATTPVRMVDSRSGVGGYGTEWGPAQTRSVRLAGVGPVPPGAAAVVVNLTAVAPTAATHVTAYPSGTTRPRASTLNVAAGESRPNLAVVKPSASGYVALYNNSGSVDLVVDVFGWFAAGGDEFHPVVPGRVLDSRNGTGWYRGPFSGWAWLFAAGLVGGVPPTARVTLLNVTGTGATAPTHLTIWPDGTTKPGTSNLNLGIGTTSANQVVVRVGTSGWAVLQNNSGEAHVIADVVGWYG
jgi:hypothetical protein